MAAETRFNYKLLAMVGFVEFEEEYTLKMVNAGKR